MATPSAISAATTNPLQNERFFIDRHGNGIPGDRVDKLAFPFGEVFPVDHLQVKPSERK